MLLSCWTVGRQKRFVLPYTVVNSLYVHGYAPNEHAGKAVFLPRLWVG